MIRFQTIDVEMPTIDYDEAKLWIDGVVKRHGKSVGELYYYFCSDDIMVYLSNHGLKPKDAFKIMEFVRKGKAKKDPAGWANWKQVMKDAGIIDWYIDSCEKIQYMFPKAHACAYVMSAIRIAWFKVYQPLNYYATYFSIRATDFGIENNEKEKRLEKAIIEIKYKMGKNAILKGMNLQDGATTMIRNKLIGGHNGY